MGSLQKNPRRLAAYRALYMSLFPISIMTLFWNHHIGMSMTQILAVQGLFGFVVALCEFPSGYIADRIGYRKTLLVSSSFAVAGWSMYATASTIGGVIVAETILGISIAMVSGSDSALLYESLRATDQEHDFGTWTGRVRFWGQTGEGTAALAAGVMYASWPALPFVVQALMSLINVGVALSLREPARELPPPGEHLTQVKSMVRHVLVDNRRLAAVVTMTIALGLASYVPVWLVPLYATQSGVPEAWIGPIWAIANYTVAIGSLMSGRMTRAWGLLPTLAACIGLVALGYLGLALTYGLFGFAWYFCLTTMRGAFGPALLHEENRLIPSTDRAGFMSMRSLLFRLTFLAVGPAVGLGVDRYGQHPVLLVLAALMTATATAGWLWLRDQRGEIQQRVA